MLGGCDGRKEGIGRIVVTRIGCMRSYMDGFVGGTYEGRVQERSWKRRDYRFLERIYATFEGEIRAFVQAGLE